MITLFFKWALTWTNDDLSYDDDDDDDKACSNCLIKVEQWTISRQSMTCSHIRQSKGNKQNIQTPNNNWTHIINTAHKHIHTNASLQTYTWCNENNKTTQI